jgi:hypothetical protein
VLPPEAALSGWPTVTLDPPGARSFVHGQAARATNVPTAAAVAPFAVVKDADGVFLGVGERVAKSGLVKPARLLHADSPRADVRPG